MELVTSNPCERLERPHPKQATARGLSAEHVKRLLAVIPDTPVGLRDRAIILTLVLTGRRRAEVLGMTSATSLPTVNRSFLVIVARAVRRGSGSCRGQRSMPSETGLRSLDGT